MKFPEFLRKMLDTPEQIYNFGRYYEREKIKMTAFEHAMWWTKRIGPLGTLCRLFYWHLFMEGPKSIADGLSFDYFGDVLFWGKPMTETPLAKYVGNRPGFREANSSDNETQKIEHDILLRDDDTTTI